MKPEAVDFLRAGLNAVGLRQSVIANNIANQATPGFRRGEVRFETALADAVRSDPSADPAAVVPEIVRTPADGSDDQESNVDLETELGDLIKNTAIQKTYLRMMTNLMKQMDLAIQD